MLYRFFLCKLPERKSHDYVINDPMSQDLECDADKIVQ